MLQAIQLSLPRARGEAVWQRLVRLPLAARLSAAFILVYVFGAVVGLIGILNLVSLKQDTDTLYQRDMRGAISAERAQAALATLGRAQLALTLATSTTERDAAGADIQLALRQLDAAVDGVRRAAPRQAQALQKERAAAGELMQGYVALINKQPLDALQFDSAVSVDGHFLGEQLQKLGALMETTRAGLERQAADTVAGVAASQIGAQTLMAALLVASFVAAGALAWFAARSLTRELGGEPRDAAAAANRIASGDLTAHINLRKGDHTSLLYFLSGMRDELAGVLARIQESAHEITATSGDIADGNQQLAARTAQQAEALRHAAASMTRLTALVEQVHEQANRVEHDGRPGAHRFGRRHGSRARHERDHGQRAGPFAQYRRGGHGDRRHRVPDQYPRAQRRRGSRTRRRGGTRLRRGRAGSARAGPAQRQRRPRDRWHCRRRHARDRTRRHPQRDRW